MIRSSLVAALILAVSSTAWGQSVPDVLSTAKHMKALCLAVEPSDTVSFKGNAFERGKKRAAHRKNRDRALDRLYTVEIGSKQFKLREYDVDDEEFEIDTRNGLMIIRGETVLTFSPNDTISTSVPPHEAQKIAKLHQQKNLTLRLGFFLRSESSSSSPCGWSRSGGRVLSVAAEVGFFELKTKGRSILRIEVADIEDVPESELESSSGGNTGPSVSMSVPTVTNNQAAGRYLNTESGPQLRGRYAGCYQRRLGQNPNLEGTIVVNFTLNRGHIARSHIEIDSVGDQNLATCVLQQTRSFSFPRGVSGVVSWPIVFSN